MRSLVAKILFVIDGVAERKTSRMINMNLEARLGFACFVQVVANYVLAFDMAMQQDFDAIVLPCKRSIDNFSTEDFSEMLMGVVGSSVSIIHTVDHDSPAHNPGRTVRSNQRGSEGYMIDDLVAAIQSAMKKSPPPLEHRHTKANKRSHQCIRYEQSQHPHLPSDDEEAAYWQYCQWWQWNQWQLFLQAQSQQGHLPDHHHPQRRSHVATRADDSATIDPITTTSNPNMPSTMPPTSPFYTPNDYTQHLMPHPYTLHHAHHSHSIHSFSPPHTTLFAPYRPSTYPYPPSQYPDFPPPRVQYYDARLYAGPAEHHCYQDGHQGLRPDKHRPQQLRAARNTMCGHVVSEDVFDDHLDSNLCAVDGSSSTSSRSDSCTSSCTTAESFDGASLDDAALQTDCYSNDPSDAIDDAEFAACFDLDSWFI